MFKFLQHRYLKPLVPSQGLSYPRDAEFYPPSSPSLPARRSSGTLDDSGPSPSPLTVLCDERTQLYVKKASPSLPLRARRASQRVQWLQVTKDLVSVAVGLVTVLQFIWPALQWIWEKI